MSDLYDVAHFETGTYRRNGTFLEDPEYARALDCFVKGCADVLLQDESTGEVLIGHRIVHPQPDWWFIGGRMRAGDTPQQAAARNVKRETGLDLAPQRFEGLCTTSMLWQRRKQEPADNGTADLQVSLLVRVAPAERAAIVFHPDEYDRLAWVAPQALAGGQQYHPALRRAAQHVLSRRAYEELEAALQEGAADARIAAAAAAFVDLQQAAVRLGALPVPFKEAPGGAA